LNWISGLASIIFRKDGGEVSNLKLSFPVEYDNSVSQNSITLVDRLMLTAILMVTIEK